MLRAGLAVIATSVLMPILAGANLNGTIVIERKLTKRNVTPTVGLYQRGSAVALGADDPQDPLDFERSHVVVYLEGALPSKAVRATLEQKDRRFVPDLLVIPVGSTVSFPNFDPVFHNVFSLSKPKTFDLGNYANGQTRTVTFPTAGTVFVYCHLHPNMAAAVVVSPNAWSTSANAAGKFSLANVPPGEYTIVAWHKAGGTFRKKISVTAQGAPDVTFAIPLSQEQPRVAAAAHH